MRLLHFAWPNLPLRLELARLGLPWTPTTPLVLGGRPWDPGSVLDRSPAAARFGVRPGQPLGVAHRLVPEATFLEADPAAYAAAFEAVLEALAAFTPAIEGETDPTAPAFGRALLGIEGLDRLWGDEATLTARARAAVAARLPAAPRAGIGNTRFGAGVAASMAREATSLVAIPAGGAAEEAAFLAPLPIRLLPAPELEGRFALFGLRRIGDLAALARSAVVARFGTLGGELHDLARGLDGRPLRPTPAGGAAAGRGGAGPAGRPAGVAPLRAPPSRRRALRAARCTRCRCRAGPSWSSTSRSGAPATDRRHAGSAPPALRIEQVLPEPVAQAALVERLLVARLETTDADRAGRPPGPRARRPRPAGGQPARPLHARSRPTPPASTGSWRAWPSASAPIELWRVGLGDPEAALPEAARPGRRSARDDAPCVGVPARRPDVAR